MPKQQRTARSRPRPAMPDKVEVPIQSTPKHGFLATIDGERQSDGTLRGANGIRWKVA